MVNKENLANFSKSIEKMVATNDQAYQNYSSWLGRSTSRIETLREYTKDEAMSIIKGTDYRAQKNLSVYFFNTDGLYRRLISHYATILSYDGLLIPNFKTGLDFSKTSITKRYDNAINYVEKLRTKELFTHFAHKVLITGTYYGVILDNGNDKKPFTVLDLPFDYCANNFKDQDGNDIVEFDVRYFDRILTEDNRQAALQVFPELIRQRYLSYKHGLSKPVIMLPTNIGLCFSMFDGRPYFLDIIPDLINYDDSIKIDHERDLEEIRKLFVQKIPHNNQNELLFEPEEVQTMHSGVVNMLKSNPNINVVTTYADVEVVSSKTTDTQSTSSADRSLKALFNKAGASSEVFSSTGSNTLESSLQNDISLMAILANQFASWLGVQIDTLFGTSQIGFSYKILPVGEYNRQKYVDSTLKLATSGYPSILPAVASGISQRDLVNLRDLENNLLELDKKLMPLTSSYTQTGDATSDEGGAPEKDGLEKADGTIKNEEAKDNSAKGE